VEKKAMNLVATGVTLAIPPAFSTQVVSLIYNASYPV
jgi:hypothetical protein